MLGFAVFVIWVLVSNFWQFCLCLWLSLFDIILLSCKPDKSDRTRLTKPINRPVRSNHLNGWSTGWSFANPTLSGRIENYPKTWPAWLVPTPTFRLVNKSQIPNKPPYHNSQITNRKFVMVCGTVEYFFISFFISNTNKFLLTNEWVEIYWETLIFYLLFCWYYMDWPCVPTSTTLKRRHCDYIDWKFLWEYFNDFLCDIFIKSHMNWKHNSCTWFMVIKSYMNPLIHAIITWIPWFIVLSSIFPLKCKM